MTPVPAIEEAVLAQITKRLAEIEMEHQVRILYAVESGSRAWGFASSDSDYDIRFIYIHSRDWYLSIDEHRDVIEYPEENLLDISGWDIRKALRLFRKSNPPLLEWLGSPILYRESGPLASRLRQLMVDYFSPRSCLHHYLSMAKGNFRDYLQGDTVKAKKYFYVLRPVLACMWIERHGTMPPMEFESLLRDHHLPENLLAAAECLLERKRGGVEMNQEPKVQVINDFLESMILYYSEYVAKMEQQSMVDGKLDELFREMVAVGG